VGVLLFLFFSLRGVPPFLGFLPKWLVVETLRGAGIVMVGVVILLGSLLNIFYYLKVVINIILRGFSLAQGLNFKSGDRFFTSFLSLSRIFLLGLFYIFFL